VRRGFVSSARTMPSPKTERKTSQLFSHSHSPTRAVTSRSPHTGVHRATPRRHADAEEEEDDDDDDGLLSEAQFSRIMAVALAGAVACRSASWTCAFALALCSTDARLRDGLERRLAVVLARFLVVAEGDARRPEKPLSDDDDDALRDDDVRSTSSPLLKKKKSFGVTDHPLARFCGRWAFDAARSDSPMSQLEALGVPWAARLAASRSSRHKRIHLEAPNTWVEATHTAVLARSTQTMRLDDDESQTHTHPVDRTTVVVWNAVGRRPAAAPPADDDCLPSVVVPDHAVVSVMLYQRNGALATIIRTCEDDGQTYHVVNDLATPLKGSSSNLSAAPGGSGLRRKHIVTHSYFRRVVGVVND